MDFEKPLPQNIILDGVCSLALWLFSDFFIFFFFLILLGRHEYGLPKVCASAVYCWDLQFDGTEQVVVRYRFPKRTPLTECKIKIVCWKRANTQRVYYTPANTSSALICLPMWLPTDVDMQGGNDTKLFKFAFFLFPFLLFSICTLFSH